MGDSKCWSGESSDWRWITTWKLGSLPSQEGGSGKEEYRCSSLRVKLCPDKLIENNIRIYFMLLTYWGSELSLACLNPTQNTYTDSEIIQLINHCPFHNEELTISCNFLASCTQTAPARQCIVESQSLIPSTFLELKLTHCQYSALGQNNTIWTLTSGKGPNLQWLPQKVYGLCSIIKWIELSWARKVVRDIYLDI